MTDPTASLEVRHVHLAEQVTLSPANLGDGPSEASQGVFVAFAEPPPVRTILTVVEGDSRRALEVVRVVEVAGRDERKIRGFYARFCADEALERAARVGTEHMEDGTPQVQPVMPDHSAALPISDAPPMAVPAPVMINDDDTGMIDVGNREYADELRSDREAPTEAGEEPVTAVAEPTADESSANSENAEQERPSGRKSRGAKKKRGRKKR